MGLDSFNLNFNNVKLNRLYDGTTKKSKLNYNDLFDKNESQSISQLNDLNGVTETYDVSGMNENNDNSSVSTDDKNVLDIGKSINFEERLIAASKDKHGVDYRLIYASPELKEFYFELKKTGFRLSDIEAEVILSCDSVDEATMVVMAIYAKNFKTCYGFSDEDTLKYFSGVSIEEIFDSNFDNYKHIYINYLTKLGYSCTSNLLNCRSFSEINEVIMSEDNKKMAAQLVNSGFLEKDVNRIINGEISYENLYNEILSEDDDSRRYNLCVSGIFNQISSSQSDELKKFRSYGFENFNELDEYIECLGTDIDMYFDGVKPQLKEKENAMLFRLLSGYYDMIEDTYGFEDDIEALPTFEEYVNSTPLLYFFESPVDEDGNIALNCVTEESLIMGAASEQIYTKTFFDIYGKTAGYNELNKLAEQYKNSGSKGAFESISEMYNDYWDKYYEHLFVINDILFEYNNEKIDIAKHLIAVKNCILKEAKNQNSIFEYQRKEDFYDKCNLNNEFLLTNLFNNNADTNLRVSYSDILDAVKNHGEEKVLASFLCTSINDKKIYTSKDDLEEFLDTKVSSLGDEQKYFLMDFFEFGWYNDINEVEIQVFYYILNTEGFDSALNYLLTIDDILDGRCVEKKEKEAAEEANFLTALYGTVKGVFESLDNVVYSVSCKIDDREMRRSETFCESDVWRSQFIADVSNDSKILGVGANILFTTLDMLPTFTVGYFTGGTSLAAKFATQASILLTQTSKSYSSTLNTALELGLSDNSAMFLATCSAFTEHAMESWSFSHLLKVSDNLSDVTISTLKSFSKNMFGNNSQAIANFSIITTSLIKQGLIESEEELTTYFANFILEEIVAGDLSSTSQRFNELILMGYSEQEAYGIIREEKGKEIEETIWVAFGSSMLMSGFNYYSSNHKAAKSVVSNIVGIYNGDVVGELTELRKQINGYLKDGNYKSILEMISNNESLFFDDKTALINNTLSVLKHYGNLTNNETIELFSDMFNKDFYSQMGFSESDINAMINLRNKTIDNIDFSVDNFSDESIRIIEGIMNDSSLSNNNLRIELAKSIVNLFVINGWVDTKVVEQMNNIIQEEIQNNNKLINNIEDIHRNIIQIVEKNGISSTIEKKWITNFYDLLVENNVAADQINNIMNLLVSKENIDNMNKVSGQFGNGASNSVDSSSYLHFYDYLNSIKSKLNSTFFENGIKYIIENNNENTNVIDQFIKYVVVTNFDDIRYSSHLSNNFYNIINQNFVSIKAGGTGINPISIKLGNFELAYIGDIEFTDSNEILIDKVYTRKNLTGTKLGSVMFEKMFGELNFLFPDKNVIVTPIAHFNVGAMKFYESQGGVLHVLKENGYEPISYSDYVVLENIDEESLLAYYDCNLFKELSMKKIDKPVIKLSDGTVITSISDKIINGEYIDYSKENIYRWNGYDLPVSFNGKSGTFIPTQLLYDILNDKKNNRKVFEEGMDYKGYSNSDIKDSIVALYNFSKLHNMDLSILPLFENRIISYIDSFDSVDELNNTKKGNDVNNKNMNNDVLVDDELDIEFNTVLESVTEQELQVKIDRYNELLEIKNSKDHISYKDATKYGDPNTIKPITKPEFEGIEKEIAVLERELALIAGITSEADVDISKIMDEVETEKLFDYDGSQPTVDLFVTEQIVPEAEATLDMFANTDPVKQQELTDLKLEIQKEASSLDVLDPNFSRNADLLMKKAKLQEELVMFAHSQGMTFKEYIESCGKITQLDEATQTIVNQQARHIFEVAENAEPKISQMMRSLEVNGARLEGFNYRFKSEGSIARKIATKLNGSASVDAIGYYASNINDSLRYTLILDEKNYVNKMYDSLLKLINEGYQVRSINNSWGDSTYQGMNTSLVSPDGMVFELQFHTDASFKTKEFLNHQLYEIYRSPLADISQINAAREIMGINQQMYVKTIVGMVNLKQFDIIDNASYKNYFYYNDFVSHYYSQIASWKANLSEKQKNLFHNYISEGVQKPGNYSAVNGLERNTLIDTKNRTVTVQNTFTSKRPAPISFEQFEQTYLPIEYEGRMITTIEDFIDMQHECFNELNAATSQMKLDEDTILYRGINLNALESMTDENGNSIGITNGDSLETIFNKIRAAGGEYTDKGFMSASPVPVDITTSKDIVLKLKCKKGVSGVDLSAVGGFENEFLLTANQKFDVVGFGKEEICGVMKNVLYLVSK